MKLLLAGVPAVCARQGLDARGQPVQFGLQFVGPVFQGNWFDVAPAPVSTRPHAVDGTLRHAQAKARLQQDETGADARDGSAWRGSAIT